MARARDLVPWLYKKAQELGFTSITKAMLRKLPSEELWRAHTALDRHNTTPILFRKLSKQAASLARVPQMCSHGVNWRICPSCGRVGRSTDSQFGSCVHCN